MLKQNLQSHILKAADLIHSNSDLLIQRDPQIWNVAYESILGGRYEGRVAQILERAKKGEDIRSSLEV